MKTLAAIAALAGVLVLGLCGAASALAAGEDSASGIIAGPFPQCGSIICIRSVTAFDAHSGSSAENPTGTVEQFVQGSRGGFVLSPLRVTTGQVTCLNVIGNRAAIGFVANPTPEFPNLNLPRFGTLIVEDNGSASADQFTAIGSGQPVTTCPDPRTGVGLQPITEGDLSVHDALTTPQARTACLAERGSIGQRAFRARYGNPRHALRNCINQKRA